MQQDQPTEQGKAERIYKIRFRKNEQIFSASSETPDLKTGDEIMIQTDHGLEPAKVIGLGPQPDPTAGYLFKSAFNLQRRCTKDEIDKYEHLVEKEQSAFTFCQKQIEKQQLSMKLIRVERYFNGSKIIFYFTAENRVDFRQLVKDLVQEFRTRVEMRQIGVRHETKMVGGLGCCGLELCCSSYINNFAPVSIKMAKEQNLPLNPVKISGICNRLLCCLTYEYSTYRDIKKEMPRPGKKLTLDGKTYKVIQQSVLDESVTVIDPDNPDVPRILTRKDWEIVTQKTVRPLKPGRCRKKNPPRTDKNEKNSE
jgi:cell fate regulator YaaT (PSP1 superfamily)